MLLPFLYRLIFFPTAFLAFMVVNSHGQIPLDSLRGPMCGMMDPDRKVEVAISPTFTRVNVIVTDAIAQVVVTQKFINPFRSKSEAVFIFPLPEQGSVHGMKFEYKDSIYVADIMERTKAQSKFDSIKNSGGQAALLLQERPNIFMQRIASLGAGDSAFIEISLSIPLKYVDGELELAFPTRIGPRYPSGGTGWNPPEERAGPAFQFNVLVESGLELGSISSPTHPVDVMEFQAIKKTLIDRQVIGGDLVPKLAHIRGVLLKSQTTYPNRDFILRLKRAKQAPDFSLALAQAPMGPGFFMLNLYPDPTLFAGKRSDLEVILLIDISGSQAGWPLVREKEIALNLFSRLTPQDNLNVLAFSNDVYYAFGNTSPVAATSQNIAKAETFVRGLNVEGGTQLLEGVKAALAIPSQGDKERIFIFLTDGFITNETAILQAVSSHPSRPTIFTFGAGNNLNRYFLEQCAKVGNGFATPMVEGDAAGPMVEAAWKRIEAPQMENLQIDFGGLEISDVLYPISNKLFLGLPYRVTGKFANGGPHTLTLSADQAGRPVKLTKTIDFSATEAHSWGVSKLWAREKMGQLVLDQGLKETHKSEIIALSLEYKVLSQYTAFLASTAQATSKDNNISQGLTSLEHSPKLWSKWTYALTLQGGLLFMDWSGAELVEAIRIYDLHGKLLFSYKPNSKSGQLTRWVWDGRDAQGKLLGRGLFLFSIQTKSGLQNRTFTWDPKH